MGKHFPLLECLFILEIEGFCLFCLLFKFEELRMLELLVEGTIFIITAQYELIFFVLSCTRVEFVCYNRAVCCLLAGFGMFLASFGRLLAGS